VDMYINGHDHCLEHIISRSRCVLTYNICLLTKSGLNDGKYMMVLLSVVAAKSNS